MFTELLSFVLLVGQINWGSGIESSVSDKQYTREYASQGRMLRVLHVNLKSASWKGNELKAVTGTAHIENEKGEIIADGPLQVLDGWMAVRGNQGARFESHPTDTQTKPDSSGAPATRPPSGHIASVTLDDKGNWVLEDNSFYFLMRSSFGVDLDLPSSCGRMTHIILPPKKSLEFWGMKFVTGGARGTIDVVRGRPTNRSAVEVK